MFQYAIHIFFIFICSCSRIQTKKQFLDELNQYEHHKLVLSNKNFNIENELQDFSDTCLWQSSNGFSYKPSIEKEKEQTVLYLKMYSEVGDFKGTKNEQYIYMARIWKDSHASYNGEAYYYDFFLAPSFKKISTRLVDWINNGKRICPMI